LRAPAGFVALLGVSLRPPLTTLSEGGVLDFFEPAFGITTHRKSLSRDFNVRR
jgi:hypothetical protein